MLYDYIDYLAMIIPVYNVDLLKTLFRIEWDDTENDVNVNIWEIWKRRCGMIANETTLQKRLNDTEKYCKRKRTLIMIMEYVDSSLTKQKNPNCKNIRAYTSGTGATCNCIHTAQLTHPAVYRVHIKHDNSDTCCTFVVI